jgi:hypothetical protein
VVEIMGKPLPGVLLPPRVEGSVGLVGSVNQAQPRESGLCSVNKRGRWMGQEIGNYKPHRFGGRVGGGMVLLEESVDGGKPKAWCCCRHVSLTERFRSRYVQSLTGEESLLNVAALVNAWHRGRKEARRPGRKALAR